MQIEWSCKKCGVRGAVEVMVLDMLVYRRIVTDHTRRQDRYCPQPDISYWEATGNLMRWEDEHFV